MFKSLLLAGLLAGPMLAFNTMAQTREDDHWSPTDVFTDAHGNTAAYYADPNNWGLGVVPVIYDTNLANTYFNAAFDSASVICVVTNDGGVGQLMAGFGGGGTVEIYPGAHFTAGFHNGGDWTGIGFVAGPGTLIVDPGADFTCASHLWVGQGTADQGTVIINGGTLHIPNGQLGVSWNGIGGTNYITITNGGTLFMSQWSSQTLGAPGSGPTNMGIMDIEGSSSQVIITNNQVGFMNTLETNGQLLAFAGIGTISAVYNPSANITVLTALAPKGPTTPVFSINPSNAIVGLGGTLTLTATASPETGYQWMFNSAPLANGSGVSGATTATLTVANFSVAETGVYSVLATNAAASPSDRSYTTSTSATATEDSFSLYPVVTINGVNGTTYVSQYATSLSGPWTSFSTNTAGIGPILVVDTTSPLSMAKFYRVTQP
jgi:Immunoglobulin domain